MDRDRVLEALEQMAAFGVPAQGAALLVDVGSDAYLSHFRREVLEEYVACGGSTCRFFEGAYGSGKSHLLSLLAEVAAEADMAVVKTDLSQALQLEDWRLITAHILQNLEMRIDGQTRRSLPEILQALGESGRAATARFWDTRLPHPGFKQAIRFGLDLHNLGSDAATLVRRFLTGERVRVADLKQHGIGGVRDALSARNAEHVLTTVLGGLFALGVRGTALLFDENERTFGFLRGIVPKRVTLGANLMRRLIDACFTGSLVGTVAVFAVLPNFMQESARAYPALGQRIEVPDNVSEVPAWRWPTLRLDMVSTIQGEEQFLRAAAARFARLGSDLGVQGDTLHARLRQAGKRVLQEHVGSGYRRPLMKELATLTLGAVDAAGR